MSMINAPGPPGLAPAGREISASSAGAALEGTGASSVGQPFLDTLGEVLDQVEGDQQGAQAMARKLAAGEVGDLSQVMLASEKAFLSLATLVQVRNKLLEAYQEFMRMQI